jgi:hypothetical protein
LYVATIESAAVVAFNVGTAWNPEVALMYDRVPGGSVAKMNPVPPPTTLPAES